MRKLSQRNFGPDLMRIICILAMIYDHTLNWNSVMLNEVANFEMFGWVILKTLFHFAGPLLLLITGYLMWEREPNKRHYIKLIKTLTIYVLFMIPVMIIKHEYHNEPYTIISIISGITSFTGNEYSWYLGMYIGLYLLIPYLNILYKNLKKEKTKKSLIMILMILAVLPSVVNHVIPISGKIFDIHNSNRVIEHFEFLSNQYIFLFPIMYYYVGNYIREYNKKGKKSKYIVLFIISLICFSVINFIEMYNRIPYNTSTWNAASTGSYQSLVLSVLVFLIFINIDYSKLNLKIKKSISFLGKHTLGTITISHTIQILIYYIIIGKENFALSFTYYIIGPILVFILSNIIVIPFYIAYDYVYKKIVNKYNLHYLDYQEKKLVNE